MPDVTGLPGWTSGLLHPIETDWQAQAANLATALAWAVGYIEGEGNDAGIARMALDRWSFPLLGVGGNPPEAPQ